MSKPVGETGIRYLNINYQKKWNCKYHVSVSINRKQFTVWRGDDFDVGKKVAKKVQFLMSYGRAKFLEWYDYDREQWLEDLVRSKDTSIIEITGPFETETCSCNCCFQRDKEIPLHVISLGRNNQSMSIRICDDCLQVFAERLWNYLGG